MRLGLVGRCIVLAMAVSGLRGASRGAGHELGWVVGDFAAAAGAAEFACA